MSLKVLINAISVRTGGAETFLRNILKVMAQDPSVNVFLAIRKSRVFLYESFENVTHISIPDNSIIGKASRLAVEHFGVPKIARKGNFDVYWQVDEMLSPVVASLKIPTISTFHTTPFVLEGDATGDSKIFNLYAKWIRRQTATKAAFPVAVSHHAKAELSGLYPQAMDRFRVIYHGVDQENFCRGDVNLAFLKGFGIDSGYFLSVSNRFVWKNYYRLIQAYHRYIAQSIDPADLVIVGGAKSLLEEDRILAYIKANGLQSKIHLIDFIDQEHLPYLYRGAKAYVFPSLRETFGMTVLEAMACGTPVLCSRHGPLPEVAGDSALYFDPFNIYDMSDALLEIDRSEKLRSKLTDLGLEHVKFFAWERAGNSYRKIIGEAAER